LCPTERQSLSPEIDRTDAQYSPQIVVLNWNRRMYNVHKNQ
jgi:hypothetical protein